MRREKWEVVGGDEEKLGVVGGDEERWLEEARGAAAASAWCPLEGGRQAPLASASPADWSSWWREAEGIVRGHGGQRRGSRGHGCCHWRQPPLDNLLLQENSKQDERQTRFWTLESMRQIIIECPTKQTDSLLCKAELFPSFCLFLRERGF